MKEFPYDVCVVGGLGHVGLPLGISLADAGKQVVLYDINEQAIKTVKEMRGKERPSSRQQGTESFA